MMDKPITLRDAVVFFVVWQILDGIKTAFDVPTAVGAAVAIIAVGLLGILWRSNRSQAQGDRG